jgi:hypothetical protein
VEIGNGFGRVRPVAAKSYIEDKEEELVDRIVIVAEVRSADIGINHVVQQESQPVVLEDQGVHMELVTDGSGVCTAPADLDTALAGTKMDSSMYFTALMT